MLKKLKELFLKNKEVILYLIFGGGTTAVDFLISYLLYPTEINIHLIHVIAWIGAVAFAYITNRIFVFESKTAGWAAVGEVIKFSASRVATLLFQEIIVWGLHDKLGISEYIVKLPAAVLVIILNYVFSRLLVFGRRKRDE